MRISMMLLAIELALIPACGNPETDKLESGTQAVAVLSEDDKKPSTVGGPLTNVLLSVQNDDMGFRILPPGVRVTVGEDLGYCDRTQADIDKDIEFYSGIKGLEVTKDSPPEKPEKYYPPTWRGTTRPVHVVVESGAYRGMAGTITRDHLHPIK